MSDSCPECDQRLHGDETFCPNCGYELAGDACPACGAELRGGDNFCPECGTALDGGGDATAATGTGSGEDGAAGSAAEATTGASLTTTTDGWRAYGYDLANTRRTAAAGPRGDVHPRWHFETESAVGAAPAVADGTVYVVETGDTIFEEGHRHHEYGHVYAVDEGDGTERWRYEGGSVEYAAPLVTDESVVVGESFGPNEAETGSVTALDREDGSVRWRFDTENVVFSSPKLADWTVYVGSHDGRLYAVDAATGRERWRFETNGDVWSSPAVADGTVFVGSAMGDGHVYAIDAATGQERWRFDTQRQTSGPLEGSVSAGVAVAGGTVFAPSESGFYALDAETGEERWYVDPDGELPFTDPAVTDDTVYFATMRDRLLALDVDTGRVRWETPVSVKRSSPVVADETVYVGGAPDGTLYAFDAATGEERWAVETGTSNVSFRSPAVVDGAVYVGTGDGVYAFSE